MEGLLGVRLPQGKIAGTLAGIALVSIPLALVVGAGYAAVRGGKALKQRFAPEPETDEQYAERMERTLRSRPIGK